LHTAQHEKCLLNIEYAILITYHFQAAEPRAADESMDGPVARHAANLHNGDWLADFNKTVPELTALVY